MGGLIVGVNYTLVKLTLRNSVISITSSFVIIEIELSFTAFIVSSTNEPKHGTSIPIGI